MVQESTWRKEAIAAKVGKRSYFHCQPITACVDVRRASLKISLKSDPVHLKLHPPVSLIAPVELYMKPKIFPAPGGGLTYNSTGAITGVIRYINAVNPAEAMGSNKTLNLAKGYDLDPVWSGFNEEYRNIIAKKIGVTKK